MKTKTIIPQDQVFWYLKKQTPKLPTQKIKTDIVVVGGGIAGLSAAQSFHDRGLSVVLLEKNYCGAGASGKSSGFITPESEFNVSHFIHLFGKDNAKKLWDFVITGVELMRSNIKKFDITCDYQEQDSLVVVNSAQKLADLKKEHHNRQLLGYDSFFYEKQDISNVLGSREYFGALRYSNTFGIDSYRYCQGMKEVLENSGVQIFEEAPVIKINTKSVETIYNTIEAENIIVCTDRFTPDLNKLTHDIYQAQTFLMLSSPLSDNDVRKVFPEKNCMVWDTDLIYQYYRLTGDNRLLIGGSNLTSIYWGQERHNYHSIFKKLHNYLKTKFPDLSCNFEYTWPGLIGVSKDTMPIAQQDAQAPNIYYISGVAGLPWGAALGGYSTDKILDNKNDFDTFFSRTRKFPIGSSTQKILGKRISFAVSNLITLYK